MAENHIPLEVSVVDAKQFIDGNPASTMILDVREAFELAICRLPAAEHIPMRQIPERVDSLPHDRRILVLCHHGARSLTVTHFLRHRGLANVSNIAGGISAWAECIDPTLARY